MKLEIRNLEDVSDFERLSLTDFSYSRIDTYKMCPSKYFYTYIQKEPRLFGEAAVLGNIVHTVLEDNVSSTETLDYDKLQKAYSEQRVSYDPDNKIKDELIEAGNEIINEFYDQYAGTKFDVLHKEYGFKFVLGSYLISGYIDRIDSFGADAVKIIDYKTGKWEISPKDIPSNLQLGIYAVAVNEIYPDKDIHAELYYLRSRKKKRSFVF
jgi:ATP-dependent helicase/DNAse subunit B